MALSKKGKERINMKDIMVVKMPRIGKNLPEQKQRKKQMEALSLENCKDEHKWGNQVEISLSLERLFIYDNSCDPI